MLSSRHRCHCTEDTQTDAKHVYMSADLCTIGLVVCCDAFKLVRGGSVACDGVATAVILCNAHHHVA